MRIRGQFTKVGNVKFVGHLDTVRMFQRAIKMAQIPIAYSEGFNPHSKVYFALPLSVGVSSTGEYIEIRTTEDISPAEVQTRLNNVLPNGIKFNSCFQIEQSMPTLMSQVDGADYFVKIECNNPREYKSLVDTTLAKDEIIISKRNKKKKWNDVDIKPLIIDYKVLEKDNHLELHLKLFAGSKQNLNVDLLLKAIFKDELENLIYSIERQDLYTIENDILISINESGRL